MISTLIITLPMEEPEIVSLNGDLTTDEVLSIIDEVDNLYK